MCRYYGDDGTFIDFMKVVGGYELFQSIETFFPANNISSILYRYIC